MIKQKELQRLQSQNVSKWRRLIQHLKLENKKHLEYENVNKIDEYIDDYFFKNTKHTSTNKYVRDTVYQLFQNIMIAGQGLLIKDGHPHHHCDDHKKSNLYGERKKVVEESKTFEISK